MAGTRSVLGHRNSGTSCLKPQPGSHKPECRLSSPSWGLRSLSLRPTVRGAGTTEQLRSGASKATLYSRMHYAASEDAAAAASGLHCCRASCGSCYSTSPEKFCRHSIKRSKEANVRTFSTCAGAVSARMTSQRQRHELSSAGISKCCCGTASAFCYDEGEPDGEGQQVRWTKPEMFGEGEGEGTRERERETETEIVSARDSESDRSDM